MFFCLNNYWGGGGIHVVVVLSIDVILFVYNSRNNVAEGMMPAAAEGTTGNNLILYAVIRVWNF